MYLRLREQHITREDFERVFHDVQRQDWNGLAFNICKGCDAVTSQRLIIEHGYVPINPVSFNYFADYKQCDSIPLILRCPDPIERRRALGNYLFHYGCCQTREMISYKSILAILAEFEGWIIDVLDPTTLYVVLEYIRDDLMDTVSKTHMVVETFYSSHEMCCKRKGR